MRGTTDYYFFFQDPTSVFQQHVSIHFSDLLSDFDKDHCSGGSVYLASLRRDLSAGSIPPLPVPSISHSAQVVS